jgi:hypothetical protein
VMVSVLCFRRTSIFKSKVCHSDFCMKHLILHLLYVTDPKLSSKQQIWSDALVANP